LREKHTEAITADGGHCCGAREPISADLHGERSIRRRGMFRFIRQPQHSQVIFGRTELHSPISPHRPSIVGPQPSLRLGQRWGMSLAKEILCAEVTLPSRSAGVSIAEECLRITGWIGLSGRRTTFT